MSIAFHLFQGPVELGPDPDEALPHEVLARIEEGCPPARAIRLWRGLSVPELAARAGVTVEDVVEAERGAPTSIVASNRIARALEVSVSLLI
ncbi:helix-turn-helix domain-containing protein [Prosthecomicrobium pneumaticum]|uniref:DNA-binding transcriptional regulator YiaG n=1 Tax=Prosthecomicrobium pneumaticum TaxID=81895 RepID=A0A7W9FR08_9HYPH|nr:helix-turn-helix transcriptional regulator [Prosthecomicrobium pneumaticum]MBB5755176.1 DNA-binding transcriptional regulator YiaG [Prosthecomicrobium pneumaticum]